jgi:hypothetical protein
MKLQVYDPPMCCSTGLCGPNVKPELVNFSNDLKWLEQQGVNVERFNLASTPDAFMSQEVVKSTLHNEGNKCLPIIVVNDSIVSKEVYPSRSQLMKFAGIENKNGNEKNDDEVKTNSETACGPGCGCNSSDSSLSKKIKTIVCVLVLLAVVGVFIYKNNTRKNSSNNQAAQNSPAFAVVATGSNVKAEATPATVVTRGKAETTTVATVAESKTIAKKSDESTRKIGVYLDSLSSLNKVALNQDAVFIFIPAPKNEIADEATSKAVNAAQQTLKSKNISLGLYTLPSSSADYAAIAAQVQAPAILIACKGRGMSAVSGEITETKLLQAFMASSRAGGGCGGSSGCGPSSSGCN